MKRLLSDAKIGTEMMGVKALVDTNILLRALFADLDLHEECKTLLKRMLLEGTELWISGQVIREFVVQATHPRTLKQPLTSIQAVQHVRAMRSLFVVADETASVRDKLLELLQGYQIQGKQVHDTNLIAVMLAYEIDTLLTLNIADFKRFEDIVTLVTLVDNPTSNNE
jgi:predicted nucleic acid-binding protein